MGDQKNALEAMEQKIVARIRASHPECTGPSASVTTAFVRLVLQASDDVLAEDCPDLEGVPPTELSDDEVRELFDSLPKDVAHKPLCEETVRVIVQAYNNLSYEWYVRDIVEHPCGNAAEYNNRANALAHFERHEEALRDYVRASELEPENPAFLLNRAQLLIQLDRRLEALDLVERSFGLMREGDLHHWQGHLTLSLVFLKCGRPMQAAICLDRHITDLRALLPYILRAGEGSCLVDKDDQGLHITARIDFAELSDLTERIGEAFSADPGWRKRVLDEIAGIEERALASCRSA
jgi:tetratricopeptide (TPR) repeat protein